jgi:ABC-type multidrug transport system ATPase subunit
MIKYLDLPDIRSSKISRINIAGLFDKFNYDIAIKEWILILIGLNGYGKSTIFRMLNYIFNYHYNLLGCIKFRNIEITFRNGSSFDIQNKTGNIICRINNENLSQQDIPYPNRYTFYSIITNYIDNKNLILNNPYSLLNLLNTLNYWIEDVEGFEWVFTTLIPKSELINLIQDYENVTNFESSAHRDINNECIEQLKIYSSTQNAVANIFNNKTISAKLNFISANRIQLISRSQDNLLSQFVTDPLEIISLKVCHLVDDFISKFSKDEFTFDYTLENINQDNYEKINLILNNYSSILSEDAKKNLKFYSSNRLLPSRLKSLFLKFIKLHEFVKLLNEENLFGFKLQIRRGLYISSNSKMNLKDLSSGEKNLIIILFELLFESNWRSLVLIDEPEISLHPAWQVKFTHILEKIKNLTEQSFLLATHSPNLIDDKFDYLFDMVNPKDG